MSTCHDSVIIKRTDSTIAKTRFQERFSVDVKCDMLDNHLIEYTVLPHRVPELCYVDVNCSSRMRKTIAEFNCQVAQPPNLSFLNRFIYIHKWISWWLRFQDLSPLDFFLQEWMKLSFSVPLADLSLDFFFEKKGVCSSRMTSLLHFLATRRYTTSTSSFPIDVLTEVGFLVANPRSKPPQEL